MPSHGMQEQVKALAHLVIKLHKPACNIGLVFFGFYLVVIGCLIFKSTFMPRLHAATSGLAGGGLC